jgi:hypothetical protein
VSGRASLHGRLTPGHRRVRFERQPRTSASARLSGLNEPYHHLITNQASSVARKVGPLLAGLLPGAIAVAWLPLRGALPNTDLASVLVVVIAAAGFIAGRKAQSSVR